MRIVACLLFAVALSAGDATSAPTELPALPSNVSRSLNLSFQDGKLRGGQDSLQVSLVAKLTERLRIVDVVEVELIEAIGDDGKPLRAHEHGGGGSGDIGQLDLTVQFDPPAANVRSLKSLVVSARTRVAAEGLRRTALKPAKDWIAKRMRIEGLAGGEVELENLGAENITLGLTPALERVIENLSFKNAAGDDIEQHGWNDSQEPGWIARIVDVALPPDGAIVLDLRQELGERSYILRAANVPITLPDRSKQPVGTLKTEAVMDDEAATPFEAVQVPALPKPGF